MLNLIDKKILITKFYMNTIIKMLIFDLKYIIIQELNKDLNKEKEKEKENEIEND